MMNNSNTKTQRAAIDRLKIPRRVTKSDVWQIVSRKLSEVERKAQSK